MLQRGQWCLLAGGDKDRLMAVLAVEPTATDGGGRERRPIQRPKRKNPTVAQTRRTLGEKAMATNRELRRALSQPKPAGDEAAQ